MYFDEDFFIFEKDKNFKDNSLIDLLLKMQIPFKIKNGININKEFIDSHSQNLNSEDFNFSTQSKILKILFNENKEIPISASDNGVFTGLATKHSQITTNIDEYLNYDGILKLYLSQIDIKEKIKQNKIFEYDHIKNIISRNFNLCNFDSINIWHSKKNTISKFHYDYYENFLYVYKGKKVIFLSPYNSNLIKSNNYDENSINQANGIHLNYLKLNRKFSRLNKLKMLRQIKLVKNKILETLSKINFVNENISENIILKNYILKYFDLLQNKIGLNYLIKTVLNHGETLYIPEGWWHKIYTIGNDNLAFNFWWNNFNKIINLNKEIFTIKSSLYSLTEKFIYNKGEYLMKNEAFWYLEKFINLININDEKGLIKFLLQGKFDLKKYIILYYSFEKIEECDKIIFSSTKEIKKLHCFAEENYKFIINKLWEILNKHNKINLLFKKFEMMRKSITRILIEDIAK